MSGFSVEKRKKKTADKKSGGCDRRRSRRARIQAHSDSVIIIIVTSIVIIALAPSSILLMRRSQIWFFTLRHHANIFALELFMDKKKKNRGIISRCLRQVGGMGSIRHFCKSPRGEKNAQKSLRVTAA